MMDMRKIHPLLKLALEIGPLVLFFFANAKFGLFWATGLFMGSAVLALFVSYALTKTWPLMPLISVVVVSIFGGLTLYLQNELFIKLKPTIVNSLFGCILLGGLLFKSAMMDLRPEGWRLLTLRWGLFFFVLAGLNEYVWRTQTTDLWVAFKVWGIMPLTFVFTLCQMPLMAHYMVQRDAPDS
jgi:intracellular septation protein